MKQKKILSVMLVLFMILSLIGGAQTVQTVQAASAESEFTINSSTGELEGYNGSGGEVVIPSQIGGVNVTSIDGTVFRNNPSITSIIIPQGVTSIGDYAFFGCINLTSITIPASVTSLGKGILGGCVKLETITLDSNNTSYTTENGVLYSFDKKNLIACPGTKSGTFTIPTGVENILDSAFRGCTLLTSVIMPDTVTTIGNGAFTGGTSDAPTNLTSVTLSNNLTSIGEHAFSYCDKLQSIIIPDSVTEIGLCAFYTCRGLKTVQLSANLVTIGNMAFSYCKLLDSIVIPAKVTSIGNYAFCDMYNPTPVLKSVFLLGAPPTTGYSVFGTASSSCKIYYINTQNYTNPWNNYTTAAFDPSAEYSITYHENGGSGSVPAAVTALNSSDTVTLAVAGNLTRELYTFAGWNTKADGSGTSYEVGQSITMGVSNIDLYALWTPIEIQSGDYKFTPATHTITGYTGNGGYLVIPSTIGGLSVTTIGAYAFYSDEGNYTITGVRIPSSVTTIYGGAFADLHSLNSVFFEGAAPLLHDEGMYCSVFEDNDFDLYYIDTNDFTAVDDKLDTQYVNYNMNPIAATDVAETDKTNLNISYYDSDSASSVTHNVKLPSIGVVCGSTITWSSSNTSVISNSGVVTRTSADTNVTMTATITYQGQTATKSFVLTVLKFSVPTATPGTADTSGASSSNEVKDEKLPVIDGVSGTGWDAIQDYLSQKQSGNYTVDMKSGSVVSQDIFDAIQGRDITLTFVLADGVEWIVNGNSITNAPSSDIDLQVLIDSDTIPQNQIDNLIGVDATAVQLSLAHSGTFGFTAQLRINLNKNNKGKLANLYYYNPTTGKLELQSIQRIDSSGYTNFDFVHASDYVVLVDNGDTLNEQMDDITGKSSGKTLYVGGTMGNTDTLKVNYPNILSKAIEVGDSVSAVTYTSSNSKVATVDKTGVIVAKKAGKTTISVKITVDGVSRTIQKTITVKAAYIKLVKSSSTIELGQKFKFTAIGYGVDTSKITWETTAKSTVVINAKTGIATARKTGTDYVVARCEDVKVKVKVTVMSTTKKRNSI